MARVFDRVGCWAFAQEAAKRLNLRVQWAIGSPRTDGFTVHLPDPGPGVLDETDYLCWCATVWHELAHVRLGTFGRMTLHVAGEARRGVPESLAAFAYNVVADIADEATVPKLEAYLDPGARRRIEHLFAVSNASAIIRHSCQGALKPCPAPTPHQIAVACGLGALMKSRPIERLRYPSCHAHITSWREDWEKAHKAPLWQSTKAARPARLGILARNLSKGRGPGKWESLARQARDLAEVLRPYWDPAQDCPARVFWPSMRPAKPGETPEDEAVAVSLGTGAQVVAAPKDPDPTTPEEADDIQSRMERLLAPIVQRLATSDDGGTERGLQNGRLRQAWRAPVDGRPFAAATVDRRREHCAIAVLLDRSGSMKPVWRPTASIAEGFADAMSKVGAVQRIAFGEDSKACGNLRRTDVGPNDTLMDEALGLADAFLRGAKGRKFVVVVTDGVSREPELCVEACRRLQRSGATVLGIAWKCPVERIRQTLPGATVVACGDVGTLAAWLGRVAQTVEAAS